VLSDHFIQILIEKRVIKYFGWVTRHLLDAAAAEYNLQKIIRIGRV
jgi:hypothetical protein